MNEKPSLRIEARFLPSGPTVADEMANAAFFLGLVTALPEEFGDVTEKMSFDDAKNNFFGAARNGLKSQTVWLDGKSHKTPELILHELLPRARRGLESAGIAAADIDRYLGIMDERVGQEKTGAQWMLDSLAAMDKEAAPGVRMRTLTAAMLSHQEAGEPLHRWEPAVIEEKTDWIDNYLTVEQFMSRDLFTVRPEDVLDLAANLMKWRHVRHVPVEDAEGRLLGIVSLTDLLGVFAEDRETGARELVVKDVMETELVTVSPETETLEALNLMREKNIGCLPVVRGEKLLGLITERDFLTVSTQVFEERLKEQSK
jgi:CBS domain-containing protein